MHYVSVYIKQAKEESVCRQNSDLVDALKNASNKTCLSQTNIKKSSWGEEGEGQGEFGRGASFAFVCF